MTRETYKSKLDEYCIQNPNGLLPSQLAKIREEMEQPKKTITDEYLDFMLWCKGMPSRQESFADYIEKELPVTKVKNILEVGGGINGRLSLLLAEKGYCMTCIDPELDTDCVSDYYSARYDDSHCLNNTKVTFRKEMFDYRTADVSRYDYVIAQEPCEATEHIVRVCTIQKVPFMVLLCGVPIS